MKYLLILPALLCVISIDAQKLEKKLIGKWMMEEVIQDGKDVSEKHNPKHNRYFVFKVDGTIESDGDPYGPNTGRYFVNNLNKTFYLDSAQGPDDDDSIWSVTFEEGKMIWVGVGTEWAERFRIVYKRVKK